MTTTRYDVLSAREYTDRNGDKKSTFTKLGVAFPMKDRDGFSVALDAIPAPTDGVYKLLLMPPKERDDRPATGSRGPAQRSHLRPLDDDPLDDSVPF